MAKYPYEMVKEPEKKDVKSVPAKNKKTHQSKKKCWLCRSPLHFKNNFPFIRCYYCKRTGHIKANCRERKMDSLLKWIKGEKVKKERKKRKKRSKTKKKFQEIYQNRLNQVAFNKGERGYELIWENTPIGVYDALGIPPNLDKIRHDDIKWKHIDKVVRFNTHHQESQTKRGLSRYMLMR